MNLSVKLQVRQSQSLVMTPQLLQSIRLLQFNHLELQAFVEREAEGNPLIAVGDGASPAETSAFGEGDAPAAASPAGDDGSSRLTGERSDTEAFADGYAGEDADSASRGADEAPASHPARSENLGAGSGGGGDGPSIDDLAEGKPSLGAHALAEIGDALSDPFSRRVAEALLAHLDEAGYLRIDTAAAAAELKLETARLEAIVRTLQGEAEPAGLFARSLSECLEIQLRRRNRLDPVMEAVLAHLPLLARRDFSALKRLTGEDEAGLLDILAEIRSLDPKPGHAFAGGAGEAVVPDVVVAQGADGTWQVELNPGALPRVIARNDYAETVSKSRLSAEERGFLDECRSSANWLVRVLDQRARTILKVAAEIVRRQDAFLVHGISHLKPLTLMAVAEAIGMHESTVSRVTSGKYVSTPRGTLEMKFFFTVAIGSSTGGEAHSAESVRHRIRDLIGAEGPGSVLSDDDIAARLKAEGVDLARRTVAKYREALGLASSVERRREMNARHLAS